MKKNQLIEGYINDGLSPFELEQFEAMMDIDSQLAKEVEEILASTPQSKKRNHAGPEDPLDFIQEEFVKGLSQVDWGDKSVLRKISLFFLIIVFSLIFIGFLFHK